MASQDEERQLMLILATDSTNGEKKMGMFWRVIIFVWSMIAYLSGKLYSAICCCNCMHVGDGANSSPKLPNYYKILDVGRTASQEEIKKARNKLALQFHPDHHSADGIGADEQFKLISDAYRVLSDPTLRICYFFAGHWGLQIHKNWNEAKQRAAENAPRPFEYPPLRDLMAIFGMEREFEEMEQAIQGRQGIPEDLAFKLCQLALDHIIHSLKAVLDNNFDCAKCKKGINGLDGLCYCRETEMVGPHCRNDECCPICKRSTLSKFMTPILNGINVVGEFMLFKK